MSGVVSAKSVSGRDGSVTLGGGPGGDVNVSGNINVSGLSPGQTGGTVAVSGGGAVNLGPTARIDARGYAGAGRVAVGGGPKGQDPFVRNALTANISAGAVIDASATRSGDGGNVTVWSDTTTTFAGTIRATGGPAAGNGGTIETSSAGSLVLGATAAAGASAAHGKPGLWLLDPGHLIIDQNGATQISNTLNGGTDISQETGFNIVQGFPSIMGNPTFTGPGDIDVDAAISWNTANTLTLSAFNSININSTITIGGAGKLVLTTNNNFNGASTGNGTLNFSLGPGSIRFSPKTAGQALTINSTAYTLLYSMADFATMNGSSGNFALAAPIDATGSGTFSNPPVGTFGGTFNGLGNTISNLTINTSAADAGLFGVSSGTIANIGLVGGSIIDTLAGPGLAGGLAGVNFGTVSNVFTTSTVSATSPIIGARLGGLIGKNGTGAKISNAFATGTVVALGSDSVGGLAGENNGSISNSFATGAVTSGVNSGVGGLVGLNSANGAITNSYAAGSVSGGSGATTYVGGLVGNNLGTIASAYATGFVTGGAGAPVGGLAGNNTGTITNGYWDTNTTGAGAGVGAGTDTTSSALTTNLQAGLLTGFAAPTWGSSPAKLPLPLRLLRRLRGDAAGRFRHRLPEPGHDAGRRRPLGRRAG